MIALFDPDRFLDAQAPVYDRVLGELRDGHKRSHWMWFVFPQLFGLGVSERSFYYALPSVEAAAAYAAHPVLGARLRECTDLVCTHPDTTARDIFGDIDCLKFRSSMTLFDRATGPDEKPFARALDIFFQGRPCAKTLSLLQDG